MEECLNYSGIAIWGWLLLAAMTALGGYMVGMLRRMAR